jgi:predicted ATPase/DNA-binding XRE family transcriptional regulator
MSGHRSHSFGALLRQLREGAGLTQEGLAARAELSVRGISDLERGVNRAPRPETAARLAEALSVTGEARTQFLQAGREPEEVPAARATLPMPPTPLIGRGHEVAAVRDLLKQSTVRLVTLTGIGGIGKTRLALEVAARVAKDYPDDVWFIDLAPLTDPQLIGAAIAQGLGLYEAAEHAIEAALITYLRQRRLLLLLDNVEQVIAGATVIARLLSHCPSLTVLVTSRAALRLRGERALAVPTLALPNLDQLALEGEQADAVALFVERFQAVQPAFRLTPENMHAVAAICIRLDGLPLAIELAAACGNLLSPSELLTRLEHRLDILTGGPHDAPPRLRTMGNAIAWSHELLTQDQKILFRRLGVFVGGATLDAALWVAGSTTWDLDLFLPPTGAAPAMSNLAASDAGELAHALDQLSSLVDRSLVLRSDADPEETRLRILETVREFALACLVASDEEHTIRRRQAAYFTALAEASAPQLRSGDQRTWLDRLEREHDNLRAVLAWALECGDAETALRLCGALALFWRTRGHLSEGRRWCAQALALGGVASPGARGDALYGHGTLAHWQGDYQAAEALYQASLALRRASGDKRGVALSLNSLGILADDVGEYDRALTLQQESLSR